MKLKIYLEQNDISVRDFADSAELSLDAVYKYIRGERKPTDPEILKRIKNATGGQVTANDFYELPPPPPNNDNNELRQSAP